MQSRKLKKILNTDRSISEVEDCIRISSYFVTGLITLDKKTFNLKYAMDSFNSGRSSLRDEELIGIWDKLQELVDNGEIKDIIEGVDYIPEEDRIPVFYYDGNDIVESYTDKVEYGNTTYDGMLIYENTHFTTYEECVDKTISGIKECIKWKKVYIDKKKRELEEMRHELLCDCMVLDKLRTNKSKKR